jgi:hypothetical protein
MKTLKIISILFLSLITFQACNDDDLNVDNLDGDFLEGGLLDIKNTAMNYVVGNTGPYTATVRVFQGDIKTTSIRIAKTFHSGNAVSNTVDNFKTITISDTNQNSSFSFDFTFSGLIEGLSIGGNALPSNDGDYTIGDYWELEYYSTTSDGVEYRNYATTQAAVSTRFAGQYKVLKGEYFRIGADNGGGAMWTGDDVSIKSIDAKTYQWAEWGILSGWADNVLYFQIDPATLKITYPEEWNGVAQLLNGQPLMTLLTNASDLTNVSPKTSTPDIAVLNANGADTLDMVYGYYTGGSGPREFYHLLEKIVD